MTENRQCIDIVLINDDILEIDEFFTIMLAANHDRVTVSTSTHTVSIIDDDGEWAFQHEATLALFLANRRNSQLGG